MSTLYDVDEISSKALKETNMRPPESAKKKNFSTVCDEYEISFKTLKETHVRELEFLSQETSMRSSSKIINLMLKSPHLCLAETFGMLKKVIYYIYTVYIYILYIYIYIYCIYIYIYIF